MSNQYLKTKKVVDKEQPLLSAPSFNEENMNLLQFPKLEEKSSSTPATYVMSDNS